MFIPAIAIAVGITYFLYPPRFSLIRKVPKYLVGVFCFWAALIFAKPEVPGSLYRPAGFSLLLLAGLLLLIDLLGSAVQWVREKLTLIFRKTPKLPAYLDEVWTALAKLASRKTGALIVLQCKKPLKPFLRGPGLPFDAEIRSEILIPLFLTASPVHDGALIVHNGRVKSVKGILPLATLEDTNPHFGTRHRAAIGITEKTDAIAFVVSEERGEISVAHRGGLVRIEGRDEFVRVVNWVLKNKNIYKLKSAQFIAAGKKLDDFA